jgi:hypothetical protein
MNFENLFLVLHFFFDKIHQTFCFIISLVHGIGNWQAEASDRASYKLQLKEVIDRGETN